MKKYILIILIMLLGLTGCSSKRYYNNFEYDQKNNFIPERDDKGFYLNTEGLKENAKNDLFQTFEEIDKDEKAIESKNDITKEERYKILFSKRL